MDKQTERILEIIAVIICQLALMFISAALGFVIGMWYF